MGAHRVSPHCRDLPYCVTEADCRSRSTRRVPRQQCGGHQRATHYRRTETEQAAVLPEPVTTLRLIQVCVHVLVLCPLLTALSSCPDPLCPSVTGSHLPIEFHTVSWGLGRTGVKRYLLSPTSLESSKPQLLHLLFLGPSGPLGRAERVAGWIGPARGTRMVTVNRLLHFSQQAPGSNCLLPLTSWPSWPLFTLRNPLWAEA